MNKSVFLSYASEDSEAAAYISEALRSAGIDVWFDQSELRGGDLWDTAIRKQIKACCVFIPIISSNTNAREEGYFRLEWKLAIDRSFLIAATKTFLLPVVIDNTREDDDRVPERFRDLHWTRLPGGVTSTSFVKRVSRLLSQESDGAVEDLGPPNRAGGQVVPHRSGRMWSALVWVALACLAGVVGTFGLKGLGAWIRGDHSEHVAQTESLSSKTSRTLARSIVVLPFLDMSEKKDQEYFSDGLSEELIDLLTQTPGLQVIARTSSFYFKGKQVTIGEIAKTLGVAHVLEGSVRKAGNTLRITAQLVRADNDVHLWSQSYDRDAKDIFKVQDEIAGAVVSALKVRLSPSRPASLTHWTSNTEAYNYFLLGKQFFDRENVEGWRRSAEAFNKAVALDPKYGAAYGGLALSEFFVADQAGDAPGSQQAFVAAERAIDLSPEQAEGYAARGYLRFKVRWDWTGARSDLEKALTYNPGDSAIQRSYGELLATVGRVSDGLPALRRATELDPLSGSAWETLGRHLAADRQFVAAHDAYLRALEIEPDSSFAVTGLGVLQLTQGNPEQALSTFQRLGAGEQGWRLWGVAMAQHSLGHDKESRQALDELIAAWSKVSALQIAEAYAWTGEKEQAFHWLDRAFEQRDGGLPTIKMEGSLLASVRGDPRYKVLLQKLNLPE